MLVKLSEKFKIQKIKMDNSIHKYFNKPTLFRAILNKLELNKTVI